MIGEPLNTAEGPAPPRSRGVSVGAALLAWCREGARTAFFRRPRWDGLRVTPGIAGALILLTYAIAIAINRLYIPGGAVFYWPALQAGWLSAGLTLWICWAVAVPTPGAPFTGEAPTTAALYLMFVAQGLTIDVVLACLYVPVARAGLYQNGELGLIGSWAFWLLPVVWVVAAQAPLIWRAAPKRPTAKAVAIVALAMIVLLGAWTRSEQFWYPAAGKTKSASLALTAEVLDRQATILPEQLQQLKPGRRGAVDLYAITYAPYADQDVFRRESAMVAEVMASRFGAQGRTIQLVNHPDSSLELPWATPLNLQRSIQKMAALMNRDEDVLFIHLTSHGAHGGDLSTHFYPLQLDPITPSMLKAWLDDAGIRYSVISVSACYSGSWVDPLKGVDRLVMTAADAEHTSYGCGREAELTFFGRAMFDEQLRKTRSFEEAHATARKLIDERERAAGKSDGYSNPQIDVGPGIRAQLARMNEELAARD